MLHLIGSEESVTTKEDSIADLMRVAFKKYGALDGKPAAFLPLGIESFDRTMGGVMAPEIGLVAARTGVGKSLYLTSSAFNAAEKGHKVMYLSCEDSKEHTGAQLQQRYTGIDYLALRREGHKFFKHPNIAKAMAVDSNMIFKHSIMPTLGAVEIVFAEAKEKGCSIVYIDHIHALDVHPLHDDMRLAYGLAVRNIRRYAIQYGLPVMYGAQLRRPARDAKSGKMFAEPDISEISESSEIEKGADYVFVAWKDLCPEENRLVNYCRLVKNRSYGEFAPTWRVRKDRRGMLHYEDI